MSLHSLRVCIVFVFQMIKHHPKALGYLDGIAVHYYGDTFSSPNILSNFSEMYPGKFVLATEACEGKSVRQGKIMENFL